MQLLHTLCIVKIQRRSFVDFLPFIITCTYTLFSILVETEETNFLHEHLESKYVLPYIPLSKKSVSSNVSVDIKKFVSTINSDELWSPEMGSSHDQWITSLVSTLLETFTGKSFLDTLVPISTAKVT